MPVPKRCIIALTSHRLVISGDRAIFSHTPTTKAHDVRLSDVAWVGSPTRAGRLTIADRVIVGLADGRCLGWEFPRLSIETGQRLLSDLVATVGASENPGSQSGES